MLGGGGGGRLIWEKRYFDSWASPPTEGLPSAGEALSSMMKESCGEPILTSALDWEWEELMGGNKGKGNLWAKGEWVGNCKGIGGWYLY